MRDWLRTLHDELASGNGPLARVVVANVRGSAPRDPGACMLVSAGGEIGTIGGGHLEFVATKTARNMLDTPDAGPRIDRFSLGASLGQCCGGIVELKFQRYDASRLGSIASALAARDRGEATTFDGESIVCHETPLWLFGAGHVARHLVDVIAPLPFAIRWVDSREGVFPANLRENVRALHSLEPADEVAGMEQRDWALVMTHSHDEDFEICRALLARGSFGWAGVIGSLPKAKRFRQRLAQRGFPPTAIARLVMPIGIPGISGKEPGSIAVAVAAQLLQLREARSAAVPAASARET
jgi:xanthine dehydrogenase accessory factor